MLKSDFWNENFIFLRDKSIAKNNVIAFYSYLESVWLPKTKVLGRGDEKYIIISFTYFGNSILHLEQEKITSHTNSCTILSEKYISAQVIGEQALKRKVIILYKNSLTQMLINEMFFSSNFTMPLKNIEKVDYWYNCIKDEMQKKQSSEVLAGLLVSLLHELQKQRSVNPYPKELQKILYYIDCNLENVDLNRQNIAEKFSVSIRTLCRIFEDNMQISPVNYIKNQRLEQARRMLSIPSMSIKMIAEKTGFTSSNYLCRTFKQHYGTSPEKFRHQDFIKE